MTIDVNSTLIREGERAHVNVSLTGQSTRVHRGVNVKCDSGTATGECVIVVLINICTMYIYCSKCGCHHTSACTQHSYNVHFVQLYNHGIY